MLKENLENLVKIGQLKRESSTDSEIIRMLEIARSRLLDSHIMDVSMEGRFISAYNAAHISALAALRWHGYRSENRFTVFQSLTDTVGWPAGYWRVFDIAHQKRNLAEYEGYFEVEESTIEELQDLTQLLIQSIEKLLLNKPSK